MPMLSTAAVPEQDERGGGRGVLGGPENGSHVAENELARRDAIGSLVRDQAQVGRIQLLHWEHLSQGRTALPAAIGPHTP
jgi:hypothetical protein